MKFAEHLSAHITPEWQSQYISYDEMKDILYSLEQNAPHDGISFLSSQFLRTFQKVCFFFSDEEINAFKDYVAQVDEQFFEKCQQELNKINNFFAGLLFVAFFSILWKNLFKI